MPHPTLTHLSNSLEREIGKCKRAIFIVFIVVVLVTLTGLCLLFSVLHRLVGAVWSRSVVLGGSSVEIGNVGERGVSTEALPTKTRWKDLAEWMEERRIDAEMAEIVGRTGMTSLPDLVDVAYEDEEGKGDYSRLFKLLRPSEAQLLRNVGKRLWDEILTESWLHENGLGALWISFEKDEIFSLDDVITLVRRNFHENEEDDRTTTPRAATSTPPKTTLRSLALNPRLQRNLESSVSKLEAHLESLFERSLAKENAKTTTTLSETAEVDVAATLRLDKRIKWIQFTRARANSRGWRFGMSIVLSLAAGLLFGLPLLEHFFPRALQSIRPGALVVGQASSSLYDAVTLNFPSVSAAIVDWEFENPSRVGKTFSFRISLFRLRGSPFDIDESSAKDLVSAEIFDEDETRVLHSTSFSTSPTPTTPPASTPTTPTTPTTDGTTSSTSDDFESSKIGVKSSLLPSNVIRITFTVHQAATYKISVKIRNFHVQGSPFVRTFLPGKIDLVKTGLCHQSPLLTCVQGNSLELVVQPRDKYNNKCALDDVDGSFFTLSAEPVSTNLPSNLSSEIFPVYSVFERNSQRLNLKAYPDKLGIFRVTLMHLQQPVVNCGFHMIVLTAEEANKLEINVAKKKHNLWYEAHLLDSSNVGGKRKVFVYISPRQITVKEFYLKIFPMRLYTFRVCPSTRINFNLSKQYSNPQIFSINDGSVSIDLIAKDRDILVATFARFLLKNIGGSETFQDKRNFFNTELVNHHKSRGRGRLPIRIVRSDIFASSYRALKNISTADWCKLFEFTFAGEEGLDYGGLRREAFDQIFRVVFQNDSGFFARFTDDQYGSVHPCPVKSRSPDIKTKYFEFAGKLVGKCLFESAQGLAYTLTVNARFSRSFLAQLIGLRVNYKYFEQDDPEFYVSKVKYILENNLDDEELAAATGLDELTFSEEIYNDRGQLTQVVDLIPNGSKIRVTNSNKKAYLDSLAQHRFVISVSGEIEAFLKGLNEIVPDSLLCIFDERELELLLCGTGKIDVADFKTYTKICSSSSLMFPRVIEWFWTVVSSFGQEELALLLQFSTGSSQLAAGGFKDLRPNFQITHSPAAFNSLPMAHTCFNQLCLPDYEDCATLHRMLLLAINEGSQGFSLQ